MSMTFLVLGAKMLSEYWDRQRDESSPHPDATKDANVLHHHHTYCLPGALKMTSTCLFQIFVWAQSP